MCVCVIYIYIYMLVISCYVYIYTCYICIYMYICSVTYVHLGNTKSMVSLAQRLHPAFDRRANEFRDFDPPGKGKPKKNDETGQWLIMGNDNG